MVAMFYIRVILSLLLLPLILAQDYYAILDIGKDASEKEIKSAYRQLSKKYHPDKNAGSDEAHHKFIEIGEAYEVLSDPEKKKVYDQFGADAVKNGGGGAGGPGGGGFHDPFDIFERMFQGGHGGPGGGFGQRQRQRGPTIKVHENLSLKQFYSGTSIEFTLSLNDECDGCHGSGSADGKLAQCPDCQGRGVIVQVLRMGIMTQQIQQMCGRCAGTGQVIKNQCKTCHGNKVTRTNKFFHVDVPPGAPRNYMDTRAGEAEKGPDFDAGDLVIEFREMDTGNMGYRRRGHNLYRTEVLSAEEALYGGWERTIEFLDENKPVKLSRPAHAVVSNGEIEVVKGFGMPKGSRDHGDLYIDYVVVMPKALAHERTMLKDEL
ncbi:DnaJ- protein scj1 [Saccharomyces pastorianus]|uniref:DnaJ-protein scj1 n=1 Tax=Saccharomyces pastorianus TaxID=27292 RepID=A0A6C1EDL3_SACPS|nr:DnaJ- protein scj1 [Saccharomyces pastorianus]